MDAIDIALIYTLTSDEKTQKRIADLAAAQEVYYVAQDKAAKDQKAADATLALALDAQKKAEATLVESDAAKAAADAKQKDLAQLIAAHAADVKTLSDEKAAFSKISAEIDKRQSDMAATLSAETDTLKLRTDTFAKESSMREASMAAAKKSIEEQTLALAQKQEALKKAMGG